MCPSWHGTERNEENLCSSPSNIEHHSILEGTKEAIG